MRSYFFYKVHVWLLPLLCSSLCPDSWFIIFHFNVFVWIRNFLIKFIDLFVKKFDSFKVNFFLQLVSNLNWRFSVRFHLTYWIKVCSKRSQNIYFWLINNLKLSFITSMLNIVNLLLVLFSYIFVLYFRLYVLITSTIEFICL